MTEHEYRCPRCGKVQITCTAHAVVAHSCAKVAGGKPKLVRFDYVGELARVGKP